MRAIKICTLMCNLIKNVESYRSGHNEAVLDKVLRSDNGVANRVTVFIARKNLIKNVESYRSGHNEAVLKTVWVQAHGGSNPSLSANKKGHQKMVFFCCKKAGRDSN